MIREVKRFDAVACRMSNALLDQYWSADPFLRPFYRHVPDWSSVEAALNDRDRFNTDRDSLATELELQHQPYTVNYPLVKANIDALRHPSCYTVTTGHQLCLATGPLFFIYKIISTINLCKELSKRYPDKHFVPVYWMATEDHDIAEIDHFHVNGQALRSQSNWQGATGRLSVEELSPVWDDLQRLLAGKPFADQVVDRLRRAYGESTNVAEATRTLVLGLFGDQGLIVVDGDKPVFKKMFAGVMRQELFGGITMPLVEEVIGRMQVRHKAQVHVRELNLFYLQEHRRDRIERTVDGKLRVVDTELVFSADQMDEYLSLYPERFSPNVILRPLYQETILPNVATVGGPAEVAYWMLLLPLFDLHGVPYPMLVPRNQALLLSARMLEKFTRQGFNEDELFLPADELISRWLMRHENLQPAIEEGRLQLRELFDRIAGLFAGIDPTLEPSVKAEAQRTLNGMDQLERKGTAALKRRHELALTQVRQLVDRVRPGGTPQERVENFSAFASEYGIEVFIKSLLDSLEPMDPRFTVLVTE